MGDLLGHGRPFSAWRARLMAAGEGIETMLSLRCVLPTMPDGCGALRGTPRRHPVPGHPASALRRPRRTIRPGMARWRSLIDRAQAGRDRSHRGCRRRSGNFNRRPPAVRHGCPSGRDPGARSPPQGRRALHGSWRHRPEGGTRCAAAVLAWHRINVTSPCLRGPRPRPSSKRAIEAANRPVPATALRPVLFPPAAKAAFASRSKKNWSSPSSADASGPPLRSGCRPGRPAAFSSPRRPRWARADPTREDTH